MAKRLAQVIDHEPRSFVTFADFALLHENNGNQESAPVVSRRQWKPAGILVFDGPSATES
jgi:hypothetical protein